MSVVYVKLRQLCDAYLNDDRILLDIVMDDYMKFMQIPPEEVAMSEEISEYLRSMVESVQRGETITAPDVHEVLNSIAEKYGCEYGLPLPATGEMSKNYPVIARGVPLRGIVTGNQLALADEERRARMQSGPQEAALALLNSGYLVRNSWRVIGDRTISIIDTSNGPMYMPNYHSIQRVAKLLNTLGTRCESQLTAEAEVRAQESLKKKISEAQWRCYLLNDCFLEHSDRSDLFYLFRKGYPTLALSFHGEEARRGGGKALAALCLHSMGFFQFTHAGLMTPTDEIICHLMLMRADEHKFWAKSGQWQVTDTRSGV